MNNKKLFAVLLLLSANSAQLVAMEKGTDTISTGTSTSEPAATPEPATPSQSSAQDLGSSPSSPSKNPETIGEEPAFPFGGDLGSNSSGSDSSDSSSGSCLLS